MQVEVTDLYDAVSKHGGSAILSYPVVTKSVSEKEEEKEPQLPHQGVLNIWCKFGQTGVMSSLRMFLRPKMQRDIWDAIPLAVMWTIWSNKRNPYVFENSNPDWVEILELIKIRAALWVKANGGAENYTVDDFVFRLRSILDGKNSNTHPV
ncbi:hypothetical protein RHMOL_Rhmol11G0123200 [Rhododendron molle]|uniref:Uncharacterized protein n=1 Tax=Rhododendron molle TaxID=49168 RepID=A0ACC0LT06_RHOML|nr:hypothetical protein RHMOL_Rhmol11G0123200 [Rhododendron molle]